MGFITILFIAFGLAMDAFAVSITSGFATKRLRINHALRVGAYFGLFQVVMPVIGWLAGVTLRNFISGVDHWIAFALLTGIGCKMLYESTKMDSLERNAENLSVFMLLMLSIATSIDALAVGVTFAFLKISIITPVVVIGTVTFVLSFAGVYIGNKLGHFFEKKIEVIGGLILIGIGLRILLEHLLR